VLIVLEDAHCPPLHVPAPFPAHELPHVPQLFASLFVSTHLPPHAESPPPHERPQTPAVHEGVAPDAVGHALAQPPQFAGSVAVLTQEPLQSVRVGSHGVVQALATQLWPGVQTVAHAPQWFGSEVVSTHWPEHWVPAAQTPAH
jgi:hypothetical protein